MPGCAVFGCRSYTRNTKNTDIKYYSFPKNNMLQEWINACKRDNTINLKCARICSLHFEPSCFQKTLRQQLLNYQPKTSRNLIDDAIPTLSLPSLDNLSTSSPDSSKDQCKFLIDIEGKPHACTVCIKKYSLARCLKKHLLTHTRGKPHKCEICNKSFPQAGTLKMHLLTHTEHKLDENMKGGKQALEEIRIKQEQTQFIEEEPNLHEDCSNIEVKQELFSDNVDKVSINGGPEFVECYSENVCKMETLVQEEFILKDELYSQ